LLPWLAGTAASAEPDLLQGDYALAHRFGMPAVRWRVPIALAAAVTLVWLSGWLLEFRALANEHSRLQQGISARFEALVPGEPMIDARLQIMRHMGLAGPAGGDLLPLLDAVSLALAEEPGVELTALSYRPGGIEIAVSASRADQLEQVRARIDAQGMPTTIAGATSRGDRVDGRIAVRSGT
jgi:general secretion pathway protein L